MDIGTLSLCNVCKQRKPLSDFYKDKSKRGGYAYTCKTCSRNRQLNWQKNNRDRLNARNARHRWKAQGIELSIEEIEKQIKKQNYACAICKDEISLDKFGYHYDHCHNTLTLREILCPPCNKGLGFFDDDPYLLELAANYIRRH